MWLFKRRKSPDDGKWPADRPMPASLLRAIELTRDAPPVMKKGDIITVEQLRHDIGCLMLCKPFTSGHVCGE